MPPASGLSFGFILFPFHLSTNAQAMSGSGRASGVVFPLLSSKVPPDFHHQDRVRHRRPLVSFFRLGHFGSPSFRAIRLGRFDSAGGAVLLLTENLVNVLGIARSDPDDAETADTRFFSDSKYMRGDWSAPSPSFPLPALSYR